MTEKTQYEEAQNFLDKPIWQLLDFTVGLYKKDPEDKFSITFDDKVDGITYKLTINVEESPLEGNKVH